MNLLYADLHYYYLQFLLLWLLVVVNAYFINTLPKKKAKTFHLLKIIKM